MTTISERNPRAGSAIMSPANGNRSMETVTIKATSGVVLANTVVGIVTTDGEYAPSTAEAVTGFEGAEAAVAVTVHEVDATTDAVKVAVARRDVTVNMHELQFHESVNSDALKAAKVEQLAEQGIIARA